MTTCHTDEGMFMALPQLTAEARTEALSKAMADELTIDVGRWLGVGPALLTRP